MPAITPAIAVTALVNKPSYMSEAKRRLREAVGIGFVIRRYMSRNGLWWKILAETRIKHENVHVLTQRLPEKDQGVQQDQDYVLVGFYAAK